MYLETWAIIYTQMLQRFIRAQADAFDLSLAQSYWQNARPLIR